MDSTLTLYCFLLLVQQVTTNIVASLKLHKCVSHSSVDQKSSLLDCICYSGFHKAKIKIVRAMSPFGGSGD